MLQVYVRGNTTQVCIIVYNVILRKRKELCLKLERLEDRTSGDSLL
jgi:hypothetical protein